MLVEASEARVRAVAKTLSADHATHRSLGVVLAPRVEDAAAYRHALDEVIAAPDGTQSYHHDIIDWLAGTVGVRSEEHTSELQSLMRISYAVFCLKTKKQ